MCLNFDSIIFNNKCQNTNKISLTVDEFQANNPPTLSPPPSLSLFLFFSLSLSQHHTKWSRGHVRWWRCIAAVIRIRLRSALKPSSVPVSRGRSLARPEPDPPVWKVKLRVSVSVSVYIRPSVSSSGSSFIPNKSWCENLLKWSRISDTSGADHRPTAWVDVWAENQPRLLTAHRPEFVGHRCFVKHINK